MSEPKDKQEQAGGSHTLLIAVLSFLPVLYLLMIGPAAWMFDRSPDGVKAVIKVVYAPVTMMMHGMSEDNFLYKVIGSYVDWWRGL